MIHARVAGTGSFLPGKPVTNNDLVARGIDTSDEWIVERTGISQRHLAEPEVTASELAYEASRRAIEAAGVPCLRAASFFKSAAMCSMFLRYPSTSTSALS